MLPATQPDRLLARFTVRCLRDLLSVNKQFTVIITRQPPGVVLAARELQAQRWDIKGCVRMPMHVSHVSLQV